MDVTCRPTTAADIDSVADLHVRGWQATYRGIVPPDFLAGMDPAGQARRRGLAPVLLWVSAATERARRFYATAGFAPDGVTPDYEIAGATLPEVRYRFDG